MCVGSVAELLHQHEGRNRCAYDHKGGFRAIGCSYNLDDFEAESTQKAARREKARREAEPTEGQLLCNYLPLLREHLRELAAEIDATAATSSSTTTSTEDSEKHRNNLGPWRMATGFVKMQVVPTLITHVRRSVTNMGKRRGAIGDAVVKAYIDSIKIARGELAPSPKLRTAEHFAMWSLLRGEVKLSVRTGELELWKGGGYEQPVPSFASHYVTGDGGLSGRRSTLRGTPQ
ncbi:hypothetical protein R1flu_008629 [Riccia fluitans]|uniref:Uncharacterized protein n=1 Tax=Riccia fluitans TaxID=41844 RepID=A0ABD1YD95_9MARC